MSKWSLIAALIALIMVALICARNSTVRISNALAADVNEQIKTLVTTPVISAADTGVKAVGDGRTIYLNGEVQSHTLREELVAIASQQPGVSRVIDNLNLADGAATGETRISLSTGGTITVTGRAPDEDSKHALLTQLRGDYGEAAVSDKLTVGESELGSPNFSVYREQWLSSMTAAAKQLPKFSAADIQYIGDRLQVSGRVDSSLTANQVVAEVATLAPDTIQKEFDIASPEPQDESVDTAKLSPVTPAPDVIADNPDDDSESPRLEVIGADGNPISARAPADTLTHIEYSNNTVTLNGAAPTDGDREWVLALAAQRVGDTMVTNRLSVMDESLGGWRELVTAIDSGAAYYTMLSAYIGHDHLTLDAKASTEAERDAAQAAISGLLPDGYSVTFNVAVNNQNIEQTNLSEQAIDCQSRLNDLLAGQVVLFETSSHTLSSNGQALLDDVSRILTACPQTGITIAGWADPRGRESYNLKLSKKRAQSVTDYLVGAGISTGRLQPVGRGETFEIGEDDDAYLERSRRVEFIVSDQADRG